MRNYWIPFQGKWRSFSDDYLRQLYKAGNGEEAEALLSLYEEYEQNRLSFFLPHGGGRDFINDWENEIVMLVAPSRTGKSAQGTAFMLFRTIPCKKEWPCFQQNGIDWHEWRGPRKIVISSYSWDNVSTLWEEYQKWCPREELGAYAPDWGKYPNDKGKARTLSLGHATIARCKLKCGSEFIFLCDSQKQAPWEGKRWDDGHFDEQRENEKWIGYLRGTSNTQGLVQAAFTLTGHVLKGRPDTGAGGWIKRELWDGTNDYGRKIGKYTMSIKDAPECVLSVEQKEKLRQQWVVIPERTQNTTMLRKAGARYWGGWESGSGLVLGEFDKDVHIIPNYPRTSNLVLGATKYRGFDHGTTRPTTGMWCEVFPWGDMVAYREYYVADRVVNAHVKNILKLCGNERQQMQMHRDINSETSFPIYMEDFKNEQYMVSVMDARSFNSKSPGRGCKIGQLYNDCGLYCTKAQAYHNKTVVPFIKKWLEIDQSRKHIMWYFHENNLITEEVWNNWLKKREGKITGAPHLYFVDTLHYTFEEMQSWAIKQDTDMPSDENCHIVGGALKYLIAEEPRYIKRFNDTGFLGKTENTPQLQAGNIVRKKRRHKYVGNRL